MIYVKDIDRMAAFYRNILGLKPVENIQAENWIEFEAGAAGEQHPVKGPQERQPAGH
jgi:catechol 2,3-dioxygenase-like lactoylglutathione lyase family enzyme